jgi:hypothetical protein
MNPHVNENEILTNYRADAVAVDAATLTFGDQLEYAPEPVVEAFSIKNRDFGTMDPEAIRRQVINDIAEMDEKYSGSVVFRAEQGLVGAALYGVAVPIRDVTLIYDASLIEATIQQQIQNVARDARRAVVFV